MSTVIDWTLHRDAFGRLVLTDASGAAHAGVHPVRAHPISAPDEGLSLVGADGHELAWVDRLADLPAGPRDLLLAELRTREFRPLLQRLVAVSTFSTPSQWTVETDKGGLEFILKTEEDIRRLGEGRLLITTSHGLQLYVADRWALDRGSRRLLERFL
ncbi:cyanophycin metabolism-associated DUF1854 family protein [Inhella gelatinilytica]|uniref:DUF1854 domain-containing protein n=1 Tax=Inhella gelatinilytica TaxID=2795030 RepID=A0A931IWQ9_9BURK|nr:DUF1854 domain-containing protein [Inhella gelatinilytica]MBH9551453.1 DUF1854 domain-containing protein [Inhella gelatinilytica]